MPMSHASGRDVWADVTAVILAGGVGSRLRPVVSDRPKGLAEVNGQPFMVFLLNQLAAAGAQRVVFSTGYMADQVEAAFGSEHRGMSIHYSHEATPLGTGGGLRLAAAMVASRTILILNGDSYCQVDLNAFLGDYVGGDRVPVMLLARQADTSRFGRVECDPEFRIMAFQEKGEHAGAGWVNAGIYAVERVIVEAIPYGRPVSLERDVFPNWIARGLRGFPCEGRFLDIGTPESYAQVETFFSALNASSAER
jgi:NDP-sugar pyrophosphorylase family protein